MFLTDWTTTVIPAEPGWYFLFPDYNEMGEIDSVYREPIVAWEIKIKRADYVTKITKNDDDATDRIVVGLPVGDSWAGELDLEDFAMLSPSGLICRPSGYNIKNEQELIECYENERERKIDNKGGL